MAYRKALEIPQVLLDRCDKAVSEICNDHALEIVRVIMSTNAPVSAQWWYESKIELVDQPA